MTTNGIVSINKTPEFKYYLRKISMKKYVLCFIIFLFAVPLLSQQTIWFSRTFEEATQKAQKENKLILIDFYADD